MDSSTGGFKFIFVIGLLLVGGYGVWTFWQAEKVPQTLNITNVAEFKGLPATKCAIGNNNNTVAGTLYIFHDAARYDVTSITTGKTLTAHVIVNREATGYFWSEGASEGVRGDVGRIFSGIGLDVITRVVCSQWWVPDGNLFIVPQSVAFTQTI